MTTIFTEHPERLVREHYENFPVVGYLLPKELRNPIAIVYQFARVADDIADEGTQDEATKISQLDTLANHLPEAVEQLITNHAIPRAYFLDLLKAFRQDVTYQQFATEKERLHYCAHSANPIGRILLYLFGKHEKPCLDYSDKICTALQIINFLQDIDEDWKIRERLYIPLSHLTANHLTLENAIACITSADSISPTTKTLWDKLIQQEIDYCKQLLSEGMPLLKYLKGRAHLQIRLTIACGLTVIEQLGKRTKTNQNQARLSYRSLPRLINNLLFKITY